MIGKTVQKAINEQINKELYSAYLYQAMSAWATGKDFAGVANWLSVQAQEEVSHAMKLYNFLLERGGTVKLDAIDAPPAKFDSVEDIFAKTLDHEKKVTASIAKLLELAEAEKDHATSIMLQWFVTEQVEEEASADAILKQVKMVEGKGSGMFMIDRELGSRTFTPPAAE